MRTTYRGFEIEAKRERSLGGPTYLYYNIFRESDGWCFEDGFEDSDEKVADMIGNLKKHVDDYFENPQDYVEDVDIADVVAHWKATVATQQAQIADLKAQLAQAGEQWEPLDHDVIQRGLRLMLTANGLDEFSDCVVCRRVSQAQEGES